jgi:hypothetical protein
MLALGYNSDEITVILDELDFNKFMDSNSTDESITIAPILYGWYRGIVKPIEFSFE